MARLLFGTSSNISKEIRVLADWILDIFFKRDVTMLKTLIEEEEKAKEVKNSDHHRHNYNT
jgi:hypothetical protein